MVLTMTVGERLDQSMRLPYRGSLNQMVKVKALKDVFLGFTSDEIAANGIIFSSDGSITAANTTASTSITLRNDLVIVWGEIIAERDINENILLTEATTCRTVMYAYEALTADK